MRNMNLVAVAGLALLAACTQAAAPTASSSATAGVTEADAAKVTEATLATWQSMDAAKIKALYAPDVVGFDYATAPLITDKAAWDKAQDAYAASKTDKISVTAQKVQIVGPDVFIFSMSGNNTSTAMPKNNGALRCTDVFHRDAGGAWLIVNEHCSAPPKTA